MIQMLLQTVLGVRLLCWTHLSALPQLTLARYASYSTFYLSCLRTFVSTFTSMKHMYSSLCVTFFFCIYTLHSVRTMRFHPRPPCRKTFVSQRCSQVLFCCVCSSWDCSFLSLPFLCDHDVHTLNYT